MTSLVPFLALTPFIVGAAAGVVRNGPAWRFQMTQLVLLAALSAGWFVTQVNAPSAYASPSQTFVGWLVVIALPVWMTFLAARLTSGAPRWVSIALIGPTVFFVTALIAVGVAVSAGLVRF